MSLNQVFLSPNAYSSCLCHGFSNEVEEVMGLLIGNFDEEGWELMNWNKIE